MLTNSATTGKEEQEGFSVYVDEHFNSRSLVWNKRLSDGNNNVSPDNVFVVSCFLYYL